MKRLIIGLLLLVSLPVAASHIVGGEIELLRLEPFRYRLKLNYYFDVTNNPGRKPESESKIWLYIYRKSDNVMMDSVQASFTEKIRVAYTNPVCSTDGITTDKLVYQQDIDLPASRYNHPGGYYVVWIRCCRNYTINNIISENPDLGGTAAGQTFYLEFPPVTIVNSSPKNFPSLGDYACPTRPYYVNFSGVDDDGDSLVYSMVQPLSSASSAAIPRPTPLPYNTIIWRAPWGPDNIVNGKPANPLYPDLAISTDGFLRVTPKDIGLYVFAVKVEEYRNKVKIGEVRRDFQMFVTDCKPAVPPQISGKKKGDPSFTRGTINIQFSNTVSDNDRCVIVNVSDADANRKEDNYTENISLRIVALNFKGNLNNLLPPESAKVIHNNETAQFTICFSKCPFFVGGAAQIGIVAYDDACALPLTDTLRVNVEVQPPDNKRTKFIQPVNDEVVATLDEGDQMSWDFEATDADNDEILLFPLALGFSPSAAGMKVEVSDNTPGLLKGKLSWDARCDLYDFRKANSFTLKLLADDKDVCNLNDPDTLTYRLRVNLPPDADPIIDTDLTADPIEIEVDAGKRKIYSNVTFNVTGRDDVDNDPITVRMIADGFNAADYGISFEKKSGVGSVSSLFKWPLLCDKFNLAERDSFNIAFLAIDSTGKCRIRRVDSLVVKIKVIPPDNSPPSFLFSHNLEFDGESIVLRSGQQLDLQLNVIDADVEPKDQLSLQLTDANGDFVPQGWTFNDAVGPSKLTSVLTWAPDCSVFRNGEYESNFYFDFKYGDDRCITAVTDTKRVKIKVIDRESGELTMEPANVFTPNGDGINDFYSMERTNEAGDLINILPVDNCQGVFEKVIIYNRWGSTVFSSNDRNFRWYGSNEAAGVYYYHVVFTNRDYKGVVGLRN